jgi:hypothetical protein
MLQTVYKEFTRPEASSIYCIWLHRTPGGPLSAVWIDPTMKIFEKQFEAEQEGLILDKTVQGQVVELQLYAEAHPMEEI